MDTTDEPTRSAKIADVAAKLAKLDRERSRLVAELKRLVEGLPEEPSMGSVVVSGKPGSLFERIRSCLAAEPGREFGAEEIATACGVPPDEGPRKSFYSSLAKLAKLGQIRRVGHGRYQSMPVAPAEKPGPDFR